MLVLYIFVFGENVFMKSRMKRAKGPWRPLVKSRKFKFKSLPRQPHLKLFSCSVCFSWIGIKNIADIWAYDTMVKHNSKLLQRPIEVSIYLEVESTFKSLNHMSYILLPVKHTLWAYERLRCILTHTFRKTQFFIQHFFGGAKV